MTKLELDPNKNMKWLHIGCVLFIVISVLWEVRDLNFLAVLNDEFGYWGTAATITGYDWSSLMQETPYYSFGYSILLIPIMMIFENTISMYHVAIIINAILLFSSYFLACYVGRNLFPKMNQIYVSLASLATVLFTANIFYAKIAWTETLLYFLMWVSTALLLSIEKKFSYAKMLSFLVVLGYMYMVHQRTIGVVVTGLLVILVLIITNNKRLSVLLIPIGVLVAAYFIHTYIKGMQIDQIWNDSTAASLNDVGLNAQTIGGIFERLFANIKDVIKSLGGKIYYLLISSCFIIFVGIWTFIKKTVQAIKDKRRYIKEEYLYTYVFMGISLLLMVGICVIQTADNWYRKDIIVYSRYMENAMGPLLLVSCLEIMDNLKRAIPKILASIAVVILGTWSVSYNMTNALGNFNTPCSPFIGAFFASDFKDAQLATKNIIIFIAIICLLWLVICIIRKKNNIRNVAFVIMLILVWEIATYSGERYVMNYRKKLNTDIVPIKEYLVEHMDSDIYYLKAEDVDQYSVNPKYLQFMIPNQPIKVIDSIDEFNNKSNGVLLTNPATDVIVEADFLAVETAMLKVYIKN